MLKTFFISDLHLQASEPQITEIFLRFLRGQAREAQALYILGDFFEVWVGDDDLSPFNKQIFQALRQATQSGLPIYFMRGNRDFLIGKQFSRHTGVAILPDPTIINLYGVRTLLMHGDSLCTFDKKYQKIRRYTTSPVCKWLALQLPLSWRLRAGKWLRGKSRQHLQRIDDYKMDVDPKTVIQEMLIHQTPRLVHGHTHRPHIHKLSVGERIVLGSWHHRGSVLVCDDSGQCRLESVP